MSPQLGWLSRQVSLHLALACHTGLGRFGLCNGILGSTNGILGSAVLRGVEEREVLAVPPTLEVPLLMVFFFPPVQLGVGQ